MIYFPKNMNQMITEWGQVQEIQVLSDSTFESLTSTHGDMSPTSASTSAPFPHVIHKLNQNKENVD